MLDLLELELQMAMDCHMCVETKPRSSGQQVLLITKTSLQILNAITVCVQAHHNVHEGNSMLIWNYEPLASRTAISTGLGEIFSHQGSNYHNRVVV